MPKTQTLWLALGREPLISAAEIYALLGKSAEQFLFIPPLCKIKTKFEPQELMKRLGGTTKIGEEVAAGLDEKNLIAEMAQNLLAVEGKIKFGISFYGDAASATINLKFVERLGSEVKKIVKKEGRSVRFVFNRETELSSVSVEKNGLTKRGREFLIRPSDDGKFDLAKTIAVQPFEAFGARDFGRPGRDDVSGMLPPKLALMMVNLIYDFRFKILDSVILDPFCGSGTILTEAALLGCQNLIGSDLSEKAVSNTQNNLEWFAQNNLKSKIKNLKLFQSDIRDLSAKIPPHSVDIIATEPYLGPPLKGRETPEQIKKTCLELADLYIAAFENFKKVLKPNGAVVFIIPRYTLRDTRYTISDKIMPRLKSLGFEKQRLLPEKISASYYLLYRRPGQFVGREIWKFRFVI